MRQNIIYITTDRDGASRLARCEYELPIEVQLLTPESNLVSQMKAQTPSLLLVDLDLKTTSGVALAQRLRHTVGSLPPTVLVADGRATPYREVARRRGFLDVVSKPLSCWTIRRTLATALGT